MLKVIFFSFLTVVQASFISRARGVTAALFKQGIKQGIVRAFSQTPTGDENPENIDPNGSRAGENCC